jgi:tetratricopeptide (TPR) repeat protein
MMVQVWKTVRVFISSTFRDMHAERDYLGRVVFPELRKRCAGRRLHLVDMDLRWGVTEEEAEQGKVLPIILDEIDRSRPFFVAIVGERYGFIPDRVTEDTKSAYPWLRDYTGYSLTALEIVHGVLRNPDLAKRSFFYFRNPQFISQVPESKREDFIAESPEVTRKVAALKEKIRASNRPVMENYPCRWDDAEGQLVDLDNFGEQVLEDLWTAICVEHPEEAEADPVAIERRMHEAFAEERSYLHVGRAEQARRLTESVQGKDRGTVVITGESGCGKSAFLASWYRQYSTEYPDDFVLAYFIGASPDSSNHWDLLRNMCQELKQRFALEDEIPADHKKLPETLLMFLLAASQGKPRIVLLLDALDQLLPLEGAHGLGWLLDSIPQQVRLVVSSLEGDCLNVLRRRKAEEIMLPPLTPDEQRQIIDALLSVWRRKLDERQMKALLAHPAIQNPLYLRVALEELRLFGIFEELTARIKRLAEDIPGLFDQVLMRLEQDHGRELVEEALSLLACSRYGLSEAELLDLLCGEGEEHFPRALWARLATSTRPYLGQREELLDFFHQQLAEAVAARYLKEKNEHITLAQYFEQAPPERMLDEYPYQLQQAGEWSALAVALSDLDFFTYAWERDRNYEWMGYWRSLNGRFEPGLCYQSALEERMKAEGETQYVTRLWSIIGQFLHDMGLYPSAVLFTKRALDIDERTLGPDHSDVATSLNNLALLYQDQGKYDEALPLYQRALDIKERTLGPDHPSVATSLNNLALLYKDQGKYDEALPLYQRALDIEERSLGPDHPSVATSLNNLALLYKDQGKYDEALPLYQRALAIDERTLGPDHPSVAISLNNLALLYKDQGKYDEALPLYQRALDIEERSLGPDHPSVAISLNNLALLYKDQGKYDEALPLYQRALVIDERTLGPDHRNVADDRSAEEEGKT